MRKALIAALVFGVSAFVPTSSPQLSMMRTNSRAEEAPVTIFAKANVKSSKAVDKAEKTTGIDYGEIAVMLVNPLNPYSWFVYFFLLINLYSTFQS